MKKTVLIFSLMLSAAISSNAQKADFPKLTGPYLGQKTPGMTLERFAENIITDNFYPHSKLTISPVGDKIYWETFIDTIGGGFALYYSNYDGKSLSEPIRDTVISKYGVYSFIFSSDGQTIYFGSQQPLPEYGDKKIYGVWFSKKANAGWSKPQPIKNTLDSTWASVGSLSINNAGDIYFVGRYQDSSPKIYCSKFVNGNYQKTEPLPDIINSSATLDPFIDPQDKFLLFSASARSDNLGIIDLYVSFKNKNGDWSNPVNLGEKINSKSGDRFSMITPDGNYLLFVTSHGNRFPSTYTHFHWTSSRILEELRPKE